MKKENSPRLIYLSNRLPAIYIEYSKIIKKADTLTIVYEGDGIKPSFESVPVAALSMILVGPGCSVSTEAVKIMTRNGCLIAFTGGGGMPLFSYTTSYRSPTKKLSQYKKLTDETERLRIGKLFFEKRAQLIEIYGGEIGVPLFNGFQEIESIQGLNSFEGGWTKNAYRQVSKKYGINYEGKQKTLKSIALANHFVYSLAHATIVSLNLDPNVGIIHGQTRGGGLVFDLADIYKPVLTLKTALLGTAEGWEPGKIKNKIIQDAARLNILEDMCDFLGGIF